MILENYLWIYKYSLSNKRYYFLTPLIIKNDKAFLKSRKIKKEQKITYQPLKISNI